VACEEFLDIVRVSAVQYAAIGSREGRRFHGVGIPFLVRLADDVPQRHARQPLQGAIDVKHPAVAILGPDHAVGGVSDHLEQAGSMTELLFRKALFVDVFQLADPADHLARHVTLREGARSHPAVRAVANLDAVDPVETRLVAEGIEPGLSQARPILRVYGLEPERPRRPKVLAGPFRPALADEEHLTRRIADPDSLRRQVDKLPIIFLSLGKRLQAVCMPARKVDKRGRQKEKRHYHEPAPRSACDKSAQTRDNGSKRQSCQRSAPSQALTQV
jgi:hypothetical protein